MKIRELPASFKCSLLGLRLEADDEEGRFKADAGLFGDLVCGCQLLDADFVSRRFAQDLLRQGTLEALTHLYLEPTAQCSLK